MVRVGRGNPQREEVDSVRLRRANDQRFFGSNEGTAFPGPTATTRSQLSFHLFPAIPRLVVRRPSILPLRSPILQQLSVSPLQLAQARPLLGVHFRDAT